MARSIILRNLIFSFHFPTYKQKVFSIIPQIEYQTTLIEHMLSGACAKKKDNCNIMAT